MFIRVSISRQELTLYGDDGACARRYAVSTAAKGAGEQRGSFRTPRGPHIVRAKIGAGLPRGAVLKARRPTGEVWSPELNASHLDRDWILSRVLWLSGTQKGFNRLGDVDSMRRFIYIHGTPDSEPMGVPYSHGCVRMKNEDVMELFDLIPVGIDVEIIE